MDRCGNARLDPGEACDDGNTAPGDTCNADCTRPPGFLTFDAAAEYSPTSNPHAPWTFGWVATPGSTFTAFNQATTNANGTVSWSDSTLALNVSPSIWKNTTATTSYGVAPGQISLHPGQTGNYGVVRFTAPQDGGCEVSIQFLAGHSGETDGTIHVNGTQVAYFAATSTNPTYTHVHTLVAGDVIDAAVGYLGNWNSDNTPVVFTVGCAYPPAGTPLITEYVEGTSNNKALEITNRGGTTLAAGSAVIRIYANGAVAPTNSLTLSFPSLAPGETWVITHTLAAAGLLAYADQTWASLSFNGDDAVTLEVDGVVVDVIGQVGNDPGAAWTAGGVTTLDQTIRRACSVQSGDPDGTNAFDPSVEWTAHGLDVWDDLGLHCP